MGEAKIKAEKEAEATAEVLEQLLAEPVTVDDILAGAAAIAVLGDFWPRPMGPDMPSAERQLQHYWSYMRRALKVGVVPAVWNRIRCLTEAMAKNQEILVLFAGEETGDDSIRYDIQGMLFRRVAATMPLMLNKPGAASITCSVFVPHDVIKSLAAGPT